MSREDNNYPLANNQSGCEIEFADEAHSPRFIKKDSSLKIFHLEPKVGVTHLGQTVYLWEIVSLWATANDARITKLNCVSFMVNHTGDLPESEYDALFDRLMSTLKVSDVKAAFKKPGVKEEVLSVE